MGPAALALARRGVPVFPVHSIADGVCTCGRPACGSPGKHPRTAHGLHEATVELAAVERWWARWPNANIAAATGTVFDAVDLDDLRTLAPSQLRVLGDLEGPSVLTGGDGLHIYVRPTGAGNRAAFWDGIDYRGAGGYVLMPPSLHLSGRRYRWIEYARLREAPEWLREALDPRHVPSAPRPRCLGVPGTAYALRALEDELDEIRGASLGTRNDTLNVAAFNLGTLIGAGLLESYAVLNDLVGAALEVGLDETEATRTALSGLRAGEANPRETDD